MRQQNRPFGLLWLLRSANLTSRKIIRSRPQSLRTAIRMRHLLQRTTRSHLLKQMATTAPARHRTTLNIPQTLQAIAPCTPWTLPNTPTAKFPSPKPPTRHRPRPQAPLHSALLPPLLNPPSNRPRTRTPAPNPPRTTRTAKTSTCPTSRPTATRTTRTRRPSLCRAGRSRTRSARRSSTKMP